MIIDGIHMREKRKVNELEQMSDEMSSDQRMWQEQ